MPLRKYRSVAEMPGVRPRTPLDPDNLRIACELTELAYGLHPWHFEPGVRKFRSLEESNRHRQERERRSARHLTCWILASALVLASPLWGSTPVTSLEPVLGAWRLVEGEAEVTLVVERDRLLRRTVYDGVGYVSAAPILRFADGVLTVRRHGEKTDFRITLEESSLHLVSDGERQVFHRLATRPSGFDIEPMELGEAGSLPAERVAKIQQELLRREEIDQEVRKDPEQRHRMTEVDAENTAWLEDLVSEVGWIDVDRFGVEASHAAFLLVQHSPHLPLMRAALPQIEKDVRAGKLDGQAFTLLYDRLQLRLGGMQRYGSQVHRGEDGPYVPGLEEPDKVDERRAEMGMGPLAEYLELMSRHYFDGAPIRIGKDF